MGDQLLGERKEFCRYKNKLKTSGVVDTCHPPDYIDWIKSNKWFHIWSTSGLCYKQNGVAEFGSGFNIVLI